MRLAALHGEKGFLSAEIACDELEFRAKDFIEHDGPCVGVATDPRPRDDHRPRSGITDCLERARRPCDAQSIILCERPKPGKLAHVVARIAGADQRLNDRPAREGCDCAAVARRLLGKIIRGADAARSGHHLHRYARAAWQMAPDVSSKQPGVKINAAACGAGNVDREWASRL
jgi:hypothetical protein